MKTLYLVLVGSLLFSGCKAKYQKGYDAGFSQGHAEGYAETYQDGYNDGQGVGYQNGHAEGTQQGYTDGHNSGYSQARTDFSSPEYESGYTQGYNNEYNANFPIGQQDGLADGRVDGYNIGYNNGYSSGNSRGRTQGDGQGYNDGYNDYYYAGYNDGEDDGFDDGYRHGRSDRYEDDYDEGYDNGYYDGYDDGYGDAYYSGYGASTNSKNPLVQLANTVNKDLIDYAQVRKFSNSQLENGSLVFSHSDSSSVDMEKLAALKETHYLNQISRQLVSKFSLSSESASSVAVVIHQYNKIAGSRELTEEDAQSFSKGLIGFDLLQIENAVKKSMKGDSADFNLLINQASEKIGTTPENFNNMIREIFY